MPWKESRPAKNKIVAAQAELLKLVDIDDPLVQCWACGKKGRLERAHIVARALGGSNDSSNFFLLCALCHVEQPDAQSREAQEQWLLNRDSEVARVWNEVSRVTKPLVVKGLNPFWQSVYADCMMPVLKKNKLARADKRTWLANLECRSQEIRAALDKVRSYLGDDYEGPRTAP